MSGPLVGGAIALAVMAVALVAALAVAKWQDRSPVPLFIGGYLGGLVAVLVVLAAASAGVSAYWGAVAAAAMAGALCTRERRRAWRCRFHRWRAERVATRLLARLENPR